MRVLGEIALVFLYYGIILAGLVVFVAFCIVALRWSLAVAV